jgi:Uri superfamily endonuclease
LPITMMSSEERGTYVLVICLDRDETITIGKLGRFKFLAGTYAYCGSAMGGYRGRVGRHFSQDKKLRWHIDYLLQRAEPVGAFLVAGGEGVECSLARMLSDLPDSEPIKGFGSSDCSCPAHLYRIDEANIPDLARKIKVLPSKNGHLPQND